MFQQYLRECRLKLNLESAMNVIPKSFVYMYYLYKWYIHKNASRQMERYTQVNYIYTKKYFIGLWDSKDWDWIRCIKKTVWNQENNSNNNNSLYCLHLIKSPMSISLSSHEFFSYSSAKWEQNNETKKKSIEYYSSSLDRLALVQ